MIGELVRLAQSAVHAAGFHVQRWPRPPARWGDGVDDFYPVDLVPRWGYGRPPHARIAALLEAGRDGYAGLLRSFTGLRAIWESIPLDRSPGGGPFWMTGWFPPMDAAVLMGMLATRRPTQYLEIGSGNSTRYARHAIRAAGLDTRIVSIDPSPRADVDAICDEVIRVPFERCDLSVFDRIVPGDVVMYDGSHRIVQNSDATAFFLEVLPRLPAGVLVHVHDIFWPVDYPPDWGRRLYSEQYLVGALLLAPTPPVRVLMPNRFVSLDPELAALKAGLFHDALHGDPRFPDRFANGASFWMEMGAAWPQGGPA